MLSKLIVSSYGILLEIAMWVIIIGSFIGGWVRSGFGAALLALVVAFIFCIVFFGAFLIFVDIQKAVRSIEARQNSSV
jgi:FtsH-binding integral membrane protein